MTGQWITNQQVEIYMKSRIQGYTQETSAAKAGLSVRTGRAIEHGEWRHDNDRSRHWRTRPDPLNLVWGHELVPMLKEAPDLQAITLLEYLQQQYPGQYGDKLLRTLQRRVKQWRATQGPEKEVMFRQQHLPGQLGLSDFTRLKRTTITIAGQHFEHLLYHFRLIFSKWSYMRVTMGGESYAALAQGLQEALQRLGGVPAAHRTDSLSSAYKNLSKDEQEDMTQRYQALCEHFSMKASRNNVGLGHENGGVESAHGHLKRRIEQALLIRNSNDFDTVETYQSFIDNVVSQHNQRNAKAMGIERQALTALPKDKAVDYTEARAVVTSSSTIDVRRVTYTVPSQLQGETLQVRLYDHSLVCYLGSQHVITLPRVYPSGKRARARRIDYKHVIHSLIKKPQAFRYSQIRDDLLPEHGYKAIWAYVNRNMEPRAACKFIVGLLYLAATENCEKALAQVVLKKIDDAAPLILSALQAQFKAIPKSQSDVFVEQHPLQHYNQYIPHHQEASYV